MKKMHSKKFGPYLIWTDFIKLNQRGTEVGYKQSNTPLTGYHERMVAFATKDGKFIVAVAVRQGKDNKDAARSGKAVIEQRIEHLLANDWDITQDDRGITWVYPEWKDLLVKDPNTHHNIFGMVDPSYLDMAIRATR